MIIYNLRQLYYALFSTHQNRLAKVQNMDIVNENQQNLEFTSEI